MNIEGKVWGSTRPLLQTPAIEIHEINIDRGGFCSTHAHQSKINAFYVLEGELIIKRHKDYGLIDETHLFMGDMCVVPAGEKHSFEACQETKALEIYWAELNFNDIIRDNVGGMV
jgi:mannose-6-phosphate isomerase-like protein (cupin superfamily)